MLTIIVFILILSLLIFVHELGHFITAKKVGIVVEEFGIGYPPRAVKVWQDEGKITLDGQEMVIGRKTKVPRDLQTGATVIVETKLRPDGRMETVKIEAIKQDEDDDGEAEGAVKIDALEKPTEYSLNWIPFGGYVKMLGEEDPTAPGSFASKSKRARFTVLVAGATMNLITAVILFTIMFMTGQPEPVGPTYVIEVVPNSPADQAGIQPNDVIVNVDGIAIEAAQDLVDYVDTRRGERITLTLLQGDTEREVNLIPRVNPPFGEGSMGVGIHTQYTQLLVVDVSPGLPADAAGLQAKDIILAADGVVIESPGMMYQYLEIKDGQPVTLSVLRDEQVFDTVIQPQPLGADHPTLEQLAMAGLSEQEIPALGLRVKPEILGQRITQLPFGQALMTSVNATASIIIQTITIPVAVLKKVIPAEQARPVGPVGIYRITDSAVEVSREENKIYPLLFLAAILSTALAVTNLLPLPALDGGRILFIIVEAIRGKRISPEKEGAIHFFGLTLLLMLMVVISFYDVSDPIDVSGMFR
ncbi:MAG TPA: RIP metalloprotease RseP [Chloroflexi bacterium]|nr:RIP metalloprotease RseP [Chloroflexota bacterium]